MYKFHTPVTNSHLFLIKKRMNDGTCTALFVLRASQHEQKCFPPQPKPKSRKLLYGTIGAVLLTGAAVAHAKNSPDTRRFLDANMPWASRFVGIVTEETETRYEFVNNKFNDLTAAVKGFLLGKEGVPPPCPGPTKAEQDLAEDAKKAFAPKTYEPTIVVTDKCDPVPPLKIYVSEEIAQLERDMHEYTRIAIDLYKTAGALCEKYIKVLHKIVEMPIEEMAQRDFDALRALRSERDQVRKRANEAATKAKCACENLTRAIEEGIQVPPEDVAQARRIIKQFKQDIGNAEKKFKDCMDNTVISDKYWEKVKEAREIYREELETLFPGINLNARRLNVNDTDLLLIYTLRQVQYLQNQIAEQQTIRELKLNRAIDCRDENAMIAAKVEEAVSRERMEREREHQKKALQIEAEALRKKREELRKQYDNLQDIMQNKLKQKDQEIERRCSRMVSEKVEEERVRFKNELAEMAAKLKAIEATLKSRAAAEQETKKCLTMWSAAEALLAATRRPNTCISCINDELKALENAGKGDPMVATVLKGISPEIKDNGVLTEKCVYDKFDQLEKTAYKVALVGSDGAPLPVYFMSWLQSKLIFPKLAEIPKDELDNRPTDFTKLDTFDIMQRARFFMDRGNIPFAIRYVNLLQGAPRAAARTWLDAARLHLEVKQAAEAVMAHASLASMNK